MTKKELNARLSQPLTESALKKTARADLFAMIDAQPVTDNSAFLTPTDQNVLDLLATLTPAEQHLLVAFAHCENTVVNGAPKNATGPTDLTTWV